MKFLITASLFFISGGSGRPQPPDEDSIERVLSEAATHFGLKNLGDIDLPSRKDSLDDQNGHPHAFNLTNDGSGNYYFGFNAYGLERYEVGELKNPGTDNEIQTVKGQYITRYVNKKGAVVILTIGYVADENGFQPFLISVEGVLSQASRPSGPKSGISSSVLGSLVGGNIG